MTHLKFSTEEIARRGKELYEKGIRAQVETVENIGKIISIDVETGDYEIDDDLVVTSRRLQAKHTTVAIWTDVNSITSSNKICFAVKAKNSLGTSDLSNKLGFNKQGKI